MLNTMWILSDHSKVNHLVLWPQHESQLELVGFFFFFFNVSYFVFLNNLQIGNNNWKLSKSRRR